MKKTAFYLISKLFKLNVPVWVLGENNHIVLSRKLAFLQLKKKKFVASLLGSTLGCSRMAALCVLGKWSSCSLEGQSPWAWDSPIDLLGYGNGKGLAGEIQCVEAAGQRVPLPHPNVRSVPAFHCCK